MRTSIINRNPQRKSTELEQWINKSKNEIPEIEYYRLQGEFNYRYVNDDHDEYVNDWIINQYSLRNNNEEKFHESRENEMNEKFQYSSSIKNAMRRNVSIGLSSFVRDDFERRVTHPTERVNQLVERMQELQTCNYTIDLEPLEKSVLLGLITQLHNHGHQIDSRFIKKLPSFVIDSEYYLKDEPGARSLYQKIKGKDYAFLLATIEFYNL